jgi:hypothetical protein
VKIGGTCLSILWLRKLARVHVLTGDDALSKIGAKYAAFISDPIKFLDNFAESKSLSADMLKSVEHYWVRVWCGAGRRTASQTSDQLDLSM